MGPGRGAVPAAEGVGSGSLLSSVRVVTVLVPRCAGCMRSLLYCVDDSNFLWKALMKSAVSLLYCWVFCKVAQMLSGVAALNGGLGATGLTNGTAGTMDALTQAYSGIQQYAAAALPTLYSQSLLQQQGAAGSQKEGTCGRARRGPRARIRADAAVRCPRAVGAAPLRSLSSRRPRIPSSLRFSLDVGFHWPPQCGFRPLCTYDSALLAAGRKWPREHRLSPSTSAPRPGVPVVLGAHTP